MHCANPVTPGGGPIDKDPPEVVSSDPPNFSINFSNKRIQLTFDEFVKLNQPNQQVIISPPMKQRPEFRIRGRSVFIDLKDELLENTTYSIFFGNSIVDITEGNALTDYLYVFSTGNYIDSLTVAGEVTNAYTLEPEKDVFVMLFPTRNDTLPADSLPLLTRPLYVTKANENGQFRLRYLRNEPFQLFALRDLNSNYMYDLPDEEIAFADEWVLPETEKVPAHSPAKDTLPENGNDTLQENLNDTLILSEVYRNYHRMRMFQEVDSTQRILTYDAFYPHRFLIAYRYSTDSIEMELLHPDTLIDWKITRWNTAKDSLMVWVTQPGLDTLTMRIADRDSVLDTIRVVLPEKPVVEPSRRRAEAEEPAEVERLRVGNNLKGRTMELGADLKLHFDHPLTDYMFSDAIMISGEDTLTGLPFAPESDINLTFRLNHTLEEDKTYQLIIPDSVFFDIYGFTNDSVNLIFRTKRLSDYGNLLVDINLSDTVNRHIIQLLDTRNRVLRRKFIRESGVVRFELLEPGSYKIKAIVDQWPNRRWDTGNYLDKRQPERVFIYPVELQVRANWDIEEEWNLSDD